MDKEADYCFGWESAEPSKANLYILPAVLKLLPAIKSGIVLDVGCGNGFITYKLHEAGYQVVGVDASSDGIELAKTSYPSIRFEVHSAYEDLRVITSKADIVVSTEVIEHLYNPMKFLKNIFTVLRPGGIFIISAPYHGYLKNLLLSLFNLWDRHFHVEKVGGHVKFFSERSLSSLLKEAGFYKIKFLNVGRVKWLWKSMSCRCEKPLT